MRYYQTHNDVLNSVGWADEDPLEPGRFVLPGGGVWSAPPAFEDGKHARWNGEGWVIEDAPPVLVQLAEGTIAGLLRRWDGTELHVTYVPRPAITDKQRAGWNGKTWIVEDVPQPTPSPTPASE